MKGQEQQENLTEVLCISMEDFNAGGQMSAGKHPKIAAFALCQVISYSFQSYNPVVLFALYPIQFKALKALTHTTL